MWLFPTLGVLYEELLVDDVPAIGMTFRAFNRWMHEDWGFAYQNRIFAAPYFSLADVDWAVEELEWALDHGARVIVMRPAAVQTATGPLSPANEHFDPFWARVQEAGITVVVHAGDSGYTTHGYARDGFGAAFGGGGWRPSIKAFNIERAAYDFLITLSFERMYERFPGLRDRVGRERLRVPARPLQQAALRPSTRCPGYFHDDPVESFREHVWINPFWEDDVDETVALMGADRVIFGSDWPHIEGMPEPLDYLPELKSFDDDEKRLILRDNARELTELKPA